MARRMSRHYRGRSSLDTAAATRLSSNRLGLYGVTVACASFTASLQPLRCQFGANSACIGSSTASTRLFQNASGIALMTTRDQLGMKGTLHGPVKEGLARRS